MVHIKSLESLENTTKDLYILLSKTLTSSLRDLEACTGETPVHLVSNQVALLDFLMEHQINQAILIRDF